ncbi:MAG: hypothetical protein K8R87_04990, partial [Verrucomicrobia bacterium]|nr:hypothetical protein [Verrucomicrobiota bacterium]
MKHCLRYFLFAAFVFQLASGAARAADDFLDEIDNRLNLHLLDNNVSVRLSGLIDIEGYYIQQPAPGLILTARDYLVNPRLTMNLDVQIGKHFYFFAQARVDRGFDPADLDAEARLDQYALRFTPWDDGRFNVQVGKFATVVGMWSHRHDSWANPFISAPLPYENVTAVYAGEAPASKKDFLGGLDEAKYDYNPIIWGPSYTSGVAISGHFGKLDYAAEMKNASISSSPEVWDATELGISHPTYSGRSGWRPREEWNIGISASGGPYLTPEAAVTLPRGRDIGDYDQYTLAQDVSYEWHHLQIWAEFFESRFQVPRVGNADVFAYFIEAKYKFTPQFFGGLRWNQQLFGSVSDGEGGEARWGSDIWRIDA